MSFIILLFLLRLLGMSHATESDDELFADDRLFKPEPLLTPQFNIYQPVISFAHINTTELRRQFIVNMTREAWNAYVTHAWGQASLKPLTLSKQKGWQATDGTTITSSLSTLWIMGLREEFREAKKWVEHEMILDDRGLVKIGALLSAYALTGHPMFREKAQGLADRLNVTDLANPRNAATVLTKSAEYLYQMSILREWISQRLEYRYLTDLTGEVKYWVRVREMETYLNLFKQWKDEPYKKNWAIKVKGYLQSNLIDQEDLKQYFAFINSMEDHRMLRSTKSNFWFVREAPKEVFMNTRLCHFGAMLILGHWDKQNATIFKGWQTDLETLKRTVKDLEMAEKITEICHRSLRLTRTGLPPNTFAVDENTRDANTALTDPQGGFPLSPELAESYFILYRITRNEKYRDYAWQLTQAIYRHCRTENGYAPVRDSNQIPAQKGDHQPADFLSGTLKYLYLTFSPVEFLPLDQWVFNSEGHPLPIYQKNVAYSTRH